MKKIGIVVPVLIALFAISTSIQAQPGRFEGQGQPGMRGQPLGQLEGIAEADEETWVQDRVDRLTKKLELNEDQVSQVNALYSQNFKSLQGLQETHGPSLAAMREEMQTVREENQGDWEGMRASMGAIRDKYGEDIEAVRESLTGMRSTNKEEMELILTEEQFETFQKLEDRQRENRGRKRPNRNGKNRKNSSSQR
ncbi:MAG: Spy/CpxP family protein refolding chaperone [Bacteroidota bacterium]